jgi:DnaJ-class molecular chaperone with C-terminal Zn finger domain
MTNYYDFLGISPLASQDEIKKAIDQKYDYWRRLVTHHQQETVEEATKALRILEQARVTLTDQGKRNAYDAGLGLGPQLGGLTDPTVNVAVPPSKPSGSPPSASSASSSQRVDAWICARCQTANPIGTRHCKNCGNQIGVDCPKCGSLTEANTRFCSNCGVNIQEFIRKKRETEDEQRKLSEAQEAERLRLQHQQERQLAEQKSQEQVRQKQVSRRSCITAIAAVIGIFICCVGVYFVWPSLRTNRNIPPASEPNFPLAQPSTDPLLDSMIPHYNGGKVAVNAELTYVSGDQFQIQFVVKNISQTSLTLAFLSSDIKVTDNLGNTYTEQYTQPIRDDLDAEGYSAERQYTLGLAGYLDPSVSELQIKFPSITQGESPFELKIPLVSIEQAKAGVDVALTYLRGDSFSVNITVSNNSPYYFPLRFNSSDVSVSDDLGNIYQINEYEANKPFADRLEGVDDYNHSRDYQFGFVPGIEPRATSLQVQANIMGKAYSSQISLPRSDQNVRYEAKVNYSNPDYNEFSVDVYVYNLADTDFILRTDGSKALLNQRGQTYSTKSDTERIGGSISPGGSTSFTLYFVGSLIDQNDLNLTLPVVSGTENVQIPVSASNP